MTRSIRRAQHATAANQSYLFKATLFVRRRDYMPSPILAFIYIYINARFSASRILLEILDRPSIIVIQILHEALWKVSTRIFRAKIIPIKLSSIYPILAIRFALPKVTKNLRFQFEIETRSRISVCSGLRTSELESAVSGHATSILNINYLGDRVEAGSFTRATRVIAPSRLYICIHISVLKFSQSSAALGTETHARIFAVRRVPAINFPTDSPDTITN